jgi:hypothetical protein
VIDPNDPPELFIRDAAILSVGGRRLSAEEQAQNRSSWLRSPSEEFMDEALQFVRVSQAWLEHRRREGRTAAAAAREPW